MPECRLRQRNEDQLLANHELEEFSYSLSHGKRNILTKRYASIGRLNKQCQHISDERVKFLIENISSSSGTMESQVEVVFNPTMITTCDAKLMRLALKSLFSYALKYFRRPAWQIDLGIVKRMGETTYFVRDNGIVFHCELTEQIFLAASVRLTMSVTYPTTVST